MATESLVDMIGWTLRREFPACFVTHFKSRDLGREVGEEGAEMEKEGENLRHSPPPPFHLPHIASLARPHPPRHHVHSTPNYRPP